MDIPGFQTLLCRGTEWAATGQVTTRDVLKPLAGYRVRPEPGDPAGGRCACPSRPARAGAEARRAARVGRHARRQEVRVRATRPDRFGRRGAGTGQAVVESRPGVGRPRGARTDSRRRVAGRAASRVARRHRRVAAGADQLAGRTPGRTGGAAAGRSAAGLGQRARRHRDAAGVGSVTGRPAATVRGAAAVRAASCATSPCSNSCRPPASRRRSVWRRSSGGSTRWATKAAPRSWPLCPAATRRCRSAAIGLLRGSAVVKTAAERLNEFPADLQVPLLAALGDSGETAALPAVTRAVSSEDPSVRRRGHRRHRQTGRRLVGARVARAARRGREGRAAGDRGML